MIPASENAPVIVDTYTLEGSAKIGVPPDSDGHPFRVLKNGVKIFGGVRASCSEKIMQIAKDDDRTTVGVGRYADLSGKELRDICNQNARDCHQPEIHYIGE